MKARSVLALVAVGGLGLACGGATFQGVPVPAAQQDLIGHWSNAEIELDLSSDGMVHYHKQRGATNVNIDGPVTAWTADGFQVGAFGITFSTFHVDASPHEVDGPCTGEAGRTCRWEATFDGQVLSRN